MLVCHLSLKMTHYIRSKFQITSSFPNPGSGLPVFFFTLTQHILLFLTYSNKILFQSNGRFYAKSISHYLLYIPGKGNCYYKDSVMFSSTSTSLILTLTNTLNDELNDHTDYTVDHQTNIQNCKQN